LNYLAIDIKKRHVYESEKNDLRGKLMIEIDTLEKLDQILEKNETVLVLFYASWCPYCRNIVSSFDKKVSKSSFEIVIHVILDDFDSPLWDEYDVEAVPTIIFFEKGKIIKRLDGKSGLGLSEKQLKVWLEELLG
jgi:thiol-disulfide isomerase/thioredoxin